MVESKSNEDDEEDEGSDEEFLFNYYDDECDVKMFDLPPSNIFQDEFPSLPVAGISSLCSIHSQPLESAIHSTYLSDSIILFEPSE